MGILAHVDSGKTTLSEAMLYKSGSTRKLGRVDNRDSFLDTDALERSRGITIFSKQAVMTYADTQFTLIDTPGHVDFSAEMERTLQILDYAILVISATDGIQSHTVTLWRLLKKYNIPCFLFINKMDMDGADKDVVMRQLRKKFSDNCIDFCADTDEITENLALCNDKLLSKYETAGISRQDIADAIKSRSVYPCLFGSALKVEGVDRLLQCIDEYTMTPKYGTTFGARVYKITEDKGQRLTLLKVTGGVLKLKEIPDSEKNTSCEKINQIRIYSGEKFTTTDQAEAGTVCAITGITFTSPGDGLGKEKKADLPVLEPVLTYSLVLPEDVDSHTALDKMKILEAEDPQLKVEWNQQLGKIQVKLMGEIQLEILQSIISDRFGMDIKFSEGSIIYKETIANTVEGVGHFEPLRHYAEVHLLMKPGKRNSGLVFSTDCKEDELDKNWQRLILTHLYEKTHIGVLTGSPITDMEIVLKSGKAHPKHTEGGDFRQATYRAIRQGLRTAQCQLLEPIFDFVLEIPQTGVGRAINDIQLMHGTFNPPQTVDDMVIITGTAPVSTMNSYSRDVNQYTHGKGKLQCTLKGYEPCHNSEQVIAKIGYDCDGDTANPCDSVFCSHGAGYNVKWDQVKSHMHLPSVLSIPKTEAVANMNRRLYSEKNAGDDLFALDKELMEIFEQTYGPIKPRNNPSDHHFTLTESKEKSTAKRKPTKKYDGTEYLLVDGYNVIFAWDQLRELSKDNIEGARNALINMLCNYRGYKKCETILVFDAYKVKGNHREIEKINNISVVYTKEAETADMYIEK
ncbi:MAG: NYN domain-containing protein, partial [Eubacterium sp.]